MPDKYFGFSDEEYAQRLASTRQAMEVAGVELLIVSDPSNMAWLTGYDGWSFYVHQAVLVSMDRLPIWYGREMDANGAKCTVYMNDDHILSYPDPYVQSTERHPMDHLSTVIDSYGWGNKSIGVEMDNYYFSAACYQSLLKNLPNANFKDVTNLVNWQKAVKSEQEITYMRRAARLVEKMHARTFELAEVGRRKNELAAEIYKTGLNGTEEFGGDYPAIVPLMPTGKEASAPHLTWDDRMLREGEGTFFELSGCYKRYHCPMSRTIFLGKPDDAWRNAEQALQEGLAAGLEKAKPGNMTEDVASALFSTFAKYGIQKDSRCGYSVGLSYPPDWGEHTLSLRAGDKTVLKPGMTFHFMPGLWFDDWGIEITETVLITETGSECLANVERKLFVKD
ncbi:ectoine hydrolase DoeA [Curvivirga sp.]|uniref:ectoine hydrolase DoeA n=1 Tax=Curvivirga sp. TaxID=2856848 RepID=UPI003B593067